MRALSKLRDGLVGAWCPSVSGWGGTILRDLSGQGNHGTLTNMDPATDWVVSEGKQALDFDGVDDRIVCSGSNSLNLTKSISVSAWARPSITSGVRVIAAKWNQSSPRPWIFLFIDDVLRVAFNSNASVLNYTIPGFSTKLYHLAFSFDSESIVSFVDGVRVASATYQALLNDSPSENVTFGCERAATPQGFFNGQLDDIRIYNRALSDQEIRTLYNGGPGYGLRPERKRRPPRIQVAPTPAPPSNKIGTTKRRNKDRLRDGLVGAWCPSVSGWGGTMLRDLSGQGNHGTLTNMDPATDWVVSGGKQALDFDGVNDYATCPVPMFSTAAFSLVAWIKLNTTTGRQDFLGRWRNTGAGNNNSWYSYVLLCNVGANKWSFFTQHNNGTFPEARSTSNLSTNLTLVAGTFDGQNIRLFIDGSLEATTGSSVPNNTNTGVDFRIGHGDSSSYLNGSIFDARVYSRSLSNSEISSLYAGGPGYGLRPQRTRRLIQGPTFNAARLRRQSLIGSGVY